MDAGQVLTDAFENLLPGLIINDVLEKASRFRRFVRKLQRKWIAKYQTRLMILEDFGHRHVASMLKDFPHLKLSNKSFIEGNHCH